MLEMYLFINPLGNVCYEAEKNILKLVDQSSEKINFRFIPLLSLNTLSSIMKKNGLHKNDLEAQNFLAAKIYRLALDYKAALFQGKKRGHDFLLNIQKQVLKHQVEYCDKLVYQIAKDCDLDLEMFKQDRYSDFTFHSFKQDQEMAAEMNVSIHPTLVLYNLKGCDYAISLADCEAIAFLKGILTEEIFFDDLKKFQQDPVSKTTGQTSLSHIFHKYPTLVKINK